MGRDSISRASASPALLGSDDPSTVKESEDLLLKFMRGPSQEDQENHVQLPTRHKTPNEPGIKPQPPKPRARIPRGNVQFRPQSIPRPPPGMQTETRKPSPKPVIETQEAVAPPVLHTHSKPLKSSPPPKRQSTPISISSQSGSLSPESNSPGPEIDSAQPGLIRRSTRARAEPTNYYKKLNLHASSESEEEAPRALTRRQRTYRPPSPPQGSASPSIRRGTRPLGQRVSSVNGLLRQRETAFSNSKLHPEFAGQYKLAKTWKGASNDVISLAWSPNGTRFAAGATAHCDEHMIPYNQKNNLLLGDLVSNELHELPDHWIDHPRRGSAIHTITDPRFFMSVTAVQWLGDTLYTASYDGTVKIWDTSGKSASCHKTLNHESKVIVMSCSTFANNLLATGTNMLGYWDTNASAYTPLEFPRPKARKDVEMVPTSIAWGPHQATKDYLIAGMSDKQEGVAQRGLLAAFRFRESSVETENFTPNSQNVFDASWHPVLPLFATACTAGQQVSRGTKSVVNIYQPLQFKTRIKELECPALDMNEVVFCPLNTNYVSAGCTDGAAYVWDIRKESEILHTLKHGPAINQLDENFVREQTDTGVNMQLWGNTFNQFYTGASDGVVKRWNILRAPEDALVEDIASLKEGVMCGALSPDKSNLLVGDVSGAIHLLSDSPYPPEEEPFIFKESPFVYEEDPAEVSAVEAARQLISSEQVEQHPVFGPGQGPSYSGPFAAWARPAETPPDQIAATPLEEKYQIRQLDGLPPKLRQGLDPGAQKHVSVQISIARARNSKPGKKMKKRKHKPAPQLAPQFIDLSGGDDTNDRKSKQKRRQSQAIPRTTEIIDLTGDSDIESPNAASPMTSARKTPVMKMSSDGTDADGELREELKEDYWWPDNKTIDPNFDPDFNGGRG